MCLHGPMYLLERTKSPQATAQVLDFVHLSDAAEAIVLGSPTATGSFWGDTIRSPQNAK